MREVEFVHQNRKKWENYRNESAQLKKATPDQVARIYLDLTTDLAFAQTHFAGSPITKYLNNLALAFHQHLYGRRVNRWREIVQFLFRDIPLAFYDSRRELSLSFIIFLVSVLIGIISQVSDPPFAEFILGNHYVAMTRENIANGHPMAVYANQTPVTMFWAIWLNNAAIDFRVFISGLLTLPVAIFSITDNGVMFGTFETFLTQNGALLDALFVVNLHGSLEIPTIVMSGAAGMALGTGWIFPKTKSRMAAFRDSARRGVLILLGTLPFTTVAALIESFITRHTEIPLSVRIVAVIAGFALSIFCTVTLPGIVHRHACTL